jgi:hypothetical protein
VAQAKGWEDMKNYAAELERFRVMLADHTPFALTLFGGDGEWQVIQDKYINVPGEWSYKPGEQLREHLLSALRWRHPRHYVGVGCKCCTGEARTREWIRLSGQDDEHLTFANLLCNGNYDRYLETWVPLFKGYDIVIAHNECGEWLDLPFQNWIDSVKELGIDCWRNQYAGKQGLIQEAAKCGSRLFLISGGTFSRMMVSLLQSINDKNTYIDIGSTLDPLMGIPPNRGYLKGEATRQKVCEWI